MPSKDQLDKDITFLLRRAMGAGRFSLDEEDRDTGVSSNSIVYIAYGESDLKNQEMPGDKADLFACERMWGKLPEHRKTKDAIEAMNRARNFIINHYAPNH